MNVVDSSAWLAYFAIYTIAQRYSATLWTQDAHFSQKLRVQYIEKKKNQKVNKRVVPNFVVLRLYFY